MDVRYVTSTDAAQLTFSLDGIDVGTIDTYAPLPTVLKSVGAVLDIMVTTSGMHTLRVRTDAPNNTASTGFYGYLHWLRLVKQ